MIHPQWMNKILRCPETRESLMYNDGVYIRADEKKYQVINEILSIVYPESLAGQDADLNRMYNLIAPLYDWSERFLGRVLTGVDMVEGRKEIISHLNLSPGMRLLEISPGPGVFQRLLCDRITNEGELIVLDWQRSQAKKAA
jgi:hypothetical protein